MEKDAATRFVPIYLVTMALICVTPLASAQTDAVEGHILSLSAPQPTVRLNAARALGELRDPVAVTPLVQTLDNDAVPEVRGWALRALDQIGTAEAREAIARAAVHDGDERVRALAQTLAARLTTAPQEAVAAPPATPLASAQVSVTIRPTPQAAPPTAAPSESPVIVVPNQMDIQNQQLQLRRQRRAGLGLRIAGWSLFGLGYIESSLIFGSMLMQSYDNDIPAVYIPVIGPIIAAVQLRDINDDFGMGLERAFCTPFLIVGSIMQVTGLALAIAGHARRRLVRREGLAQQRARRVAVLPGGPTGAGVGVVGVF